MHINVSMSDIAVANELFNRIEKQRKSLRLTQDELARQIGISRKSYCSAIKTGKTSLLNFIAILRRLELLENLEQIAIAPERSPMATLKSTNPRLVRKPAQTSAIGMALNDKTKVDDTKKLATVIMDALKQVESTPLDNSEHKSRNPIIASRKRLKYQE
jgi:transcriptional regulator with XRE-family HTH domain